MRNTVISALFIVSITSFYPQKVGKTQTKKEPKPPVITVVINPNDKIADERQIEIAKTRAVIEQVQESVIKDLKKEVADKKIAKKESKVKIAYRTVYKTIIDTVFLPSLLDTNIYIKKMDCKADTVYLPTPPRKKRGIFKIFN